MSKPSHELAINPLFFDVLSEKFQPPSDPLKRHHSLGRLAVATATKGENIGIAPGDEEMRENYLYVPSWAPTVESQIVGDVLFDMTKERSTLCIDALYLNEPRSDSELAVSAFSRPNEQGIMVSTLHLRCFLPTREIYSDTSFDLTLDPEELSTITSAVTTAAQRFFESIK